MLDKTSIAKKSRCYKLQSDRVVFRTSSADTRLVTMGMPKKAKGKKGGKAKKHGGGKGGVRPIGSFDARSRKLRMLLAARLM